MDFTNTTDDDSQQSDDNLPDGFNDADTFADLVADADTPLPHTPNDREPADGWNLTRREAAIAERELPDDVLGTVLVPGKQTINLQLTRGIAEVDILLDPADYGHEVRTLREVLAIEFTRDAAAIDPSVTSVDDDAPAIEGGVDVMDGDHATGFGDDDPVCPECDGTNIVEFDTGDAVCQNRDCNANFDL